MKKTFIMFVAIITFSLFQFISPAQEAAAAYADGTYDLPFEMKEAGSDSASIADGYFSKPAKLVVKDGVSYVQLTTTESDWVRSLSGPKGQASNVSESGNTRTLQFEVGDLSGPVTLGMHIVVPEEVAGMEYDHNHKVRAVFDASAVPTTSSSSEEVEQVNGGEGKDSTSSSTPEKTSESNPKTGDTSPIGVYVFLLILSIGTYVIYHIRTAKN